ncbi:hypothetical protein D3C72_976220 [compost metagenome]
MGVTFRQRSDDGAPVSFLGAAADIIDRAAEFAEQGLIHRFQHLGITDDRDQQAAACPAQPKQLARGGVSQSNAASGYIVCFAAADDQDGIVQRLKHVPQQGAVRREIGRSAAVQVADADQRLRSAIDQPGRRSHGHRPRRQPARHFGLHHRQHHHDQNGHAPTGASCPEPGRGGRGDRRRRMLIRHEDRRYLIVQRLALDWSRPERRPGGRRFLRIA